MRNTIIMAHRCSAACLLAVLVVAVVNGDEGSAEPGGGNGNPLATSSSASRSNSNLMISRRLLNAKKPHRPIRDDPDLTPALAAVPGTTSDEAMMMRGTSSSNNSQTVNHSIGASMANATAARRAVVFLLSETKHHETMRFARELAASPQGYDVYVVLDTEPMNNNSVVLSPDGGVTVATVSSQLCEEKGLIMSGFGVHNARTWKRKPVTSWDRALYLFGVAQREMHDQVSRMHAPMYDPST